MFARAHASGLGFGFSQFAVFSVYALAFWYGGQLIRHGEMTFSEVLKVGSASQSVATLPLFCFERLLHRTVLEHNSTFLHAMLTSSHQQASRYA